jgi:hypothetical protein
MHNQITNYLKLHNILNPNQYGFRTNHSTDLASAHLVDRIISRFDKGFKNVGIFMDLSKAFDTLDHTILLRKLKHYGFAGDSLALLKDYLSGREQSVLLNSTLSKPLRIITGVPQGSILGPLLFTLYINDITNASKTLESILYADDTTLIFNPTKSQKNATISRIINRELEYLNQWFQANKLSLNVEKTKYIVFHRPRATAPQVHLRINGTELERVKNFKFLGLTINENMTWKDHITNIKIKISKTIGVMHKLKYIVPKEILLTLYHSLILPHLHFQIISWGKSNIDKLVLLQKRAIRIIIGSHYLAHTSPLFINLNLLKLSDLYNIACLKFLFKLENKTLPQYFLNWDLRRNQDYHSYLTRYRNNTTSLSHHNDYFENLIRYVLVKFRNDLPNQFYSKIKTHSVSSISENYKKFLIDNYNALCTNRNCYTCMLTNSSL